MLPDHTRPLGQTDLARLDRFLHTTACGGDAMGLSYAHGFLTAVASGPERLEPAEWLRLMFDEPVFGSGDEAREMLGLALRLFGEIERGLAEDGGFRPVFDYVRDGGGRTHVDAQRWCRGFASGFALFSERWTQDRERRPVPSRSRSGVFSIFAPTPARGPPTGPNSARPSRAGLNPETPPRSM